MKLPKWDPPEEIVQRSLDAQHSLLTGYYSNLKVDQKKLREAFSPKHVAISLTGEPTLYESLDSLLDSFHKRRFTTFLVSNGTVPSAFKKLSHEPTQLYISLCAPDERVFNAICRPLMPNTWDRLNETLSFLPSFTCPTVLRITSVKTLNMKHTEAYARLVKRAQPTYIEVKAYMHVGFSRLRLGYESMPEHSAIKGFAENLAENIGYNFIDESTESRVVLLSTLERARKIGEA